MILFGPHRLLLYGQKQFFKYLLLSSTDEKENPTGLQHESE